MSLAYLLTNVALLFTAIGVAMWVRYPYKGSWLLVALYVAVALCGFIGIIIGAVQLWS